MNTKVFVPNVAPYQPQLPESMQHLFEHHILDPNLTPEHLKRGSTQTKKTYLFVSSGQRDTTLYRTPSAFTIPLTTPMNDVQSVRVVECTLPNASPYNAQAVVGIRIGGFHNVALGDTHMTAVGTLDTVNGSTLRMHGDTLQQVVPTEPNGLQRLTKVDVSLHDASGAPLTTGNQSPPLNALQQVTLLLEITTVEHRLEQRHTHIRGQ